MKDERLDEIIGSLPRVRVSDDFTARVLARIDEHPARRHGFPWMAAAAIALCVLIAGIASQHFVEKKQREEQLQAARVEQAEIERELREVKRLSARTSPVVYLGSTMDADYLVDLRQLHATDPPVEPVSLAPPNMY